MSDIRLRKLLVTGGAGFIGSAFVRQRLRVDPEITITVLDKLTYAGSEENLGEARTDPRLRFVQGDICDPARVAELAVDADAIVNFAAESHVDRSLINAGDFVQTDVYGTYVLLEAARKYRHQRFLQVSTDEVYGHVKDGRSKETDVLMPRSPYSATKAGGEMLVGAYHASFGLPTLITRGANTYGPYQFPEKIIPLFITNALQDLPLPIYGNGSAVRDYLFVDDHVSAIARILWKGDPGQVYNIGSGSEVSGVEVADTVLQLCGKPKSLKHFVKDRAGHDYRYALDTRQLKPLGWEAEMKFAAGMKQTVAWYQQNEAWWRQRKSDEFWKYYESNYRGLPANALPPRS
ncbi:MAG: dTDP-glucose 4,6-dehydratase [Candidatus Dormibacteraeota bacterium]|nr:dTDP-glucose 4,6-dehydratase [Candidatus Dormibacteraeota bacterium]